MATPESTLAGATRSEVAGGREADPQGAGQASGHVQPALLDVLMVAALLGVSRSFVRKLHDSGQIPRPVRLGRVVRWRHDEVLAWIDAGCPSRDRWETRRGLG